MDTTKTLSANTDAAVEELRATYWRLINTRDAWRRHANPRLHLAAFSLNEAAEIVGAVLLRHLENTEGNN